MIPVSDEERGPRRDYIRIVGVVYFYYLDRVSPDADFGKTEICIPEEFVG